LPDALEPLPHLLGLRRVAKLAEQRRDCLRVAGICRADACVA
jgi:hypothetical protein